MCRGRTEAIRNVSKDEECATDRETNFGVIRERDLAYKQAIEE